MKLWWLHKNREQDLQDEIQSHLQMSVEDRIARGESANNAQHGAQKEFGNVRLVKEVTREMWGWRWPGELMQDLRYAWRMLAKSPGFTSVIIITLAVGIGANTAIFSVVNPILFEPLPYPHAERIQLISDFGVEGSQIDVTFGTYRELEQRSRSFDALGVADVWQPAITSTAKPERLDGQRISASYFRVFGIPPALGRGFDGSDSQFRGPKVAILSDALVRRRFGGDATIVGRQITLDGDSYTVVGVMPRSFENVLLPSAEIWAPLQYRSPAPFQGPEWGHHLRMVGRLKAGVTPDLARREIGGIGNAQMTEFPRPPWANFKQGLIVHALQEDVTRGVRPALLAVLGAVVLVLTIACVNVTNLLLARSAKRRGEFAMRAALGAGRTRLIRQMLTESLLLAAIGGAFGLMVAEWGISALVALSPPGLPRASEIGLHGPVFVFAFGITTLIGLTVGLIPALHASRGDLHTAMQESSSRTTGGHHLTRRALVVAEVALALILLVSAGLLLRSLQRLFAVSPGFEAAHLLTMQVVAAGHQYNPDIARYRFFEQALDAVRKVPGVTSAAFTSQLPLSSDFEKYGVAFETATPENPNEDGSAFRYAVTPGYLEAMRILLLRGRKLDAHDVAGAPEAILINESFAKRKFPGQDPIGQRLRLGPEISRTDRPWDVIVGVVGDVKQESLALGQPDAFYVAMGQWWWVDNVQSLVVRTTGDAAALAPAIRNAIWSVDKDQPIVRIATMDSLVETSAANRRFALITFEAFAIAALLLAATGIYGVLTGNVSERTREIGVRVALGASRRSILALVFRQGMLMTGFGAVIGLGGATAASRALVTMLFGVSPLDPSTYFGVLMVLAGVSAIACWLPAWRAARVDPMVALRYE